MSLSFSQAVAELVVISAKELDYLDIYASHVCPNCDGPITVSEHEHFGLCHSCVFPSQYLN